VNKGALATDRLRVRQKVPRYQSPHHGGKDGGAQTGEAPPLRLCEKKGHVPKKNLSKHGGGRPEIKLLKRPEREKGK